MRTPIRSSQPPAESVSFADTVQQTADDVPYHRHYGQVKHDEKGSSENVMPRRKKYEGMTTIFTQLLIPGRGHPIPDAAITIHNDKIAWVGRQEDLPDEYNSPEWVDGIPVIMPGMWDVHCHYVGIDVAANLTGAYTGFLPGVSALIGAVTVEDLRETLEMGYTSVRELQGYAGDLVPAIKMGRLISPNVYSSHTALSITGGHGDEQGAPLSQVKHAMYNSGAPIAVCDGVDECIRTVRQMVRRGATCIKVCSSGGVLSPNDDPEDRQFSDDELKAIVDEAARSRRSVAAHAIGKAGILAALRAGVRSIEHGMYLDDEVCDLMLEKGAYFVSTQHIVRALQKDPNLPPETRRKLLVIAERSKESYRTAVKRGVKIALGTDMLSSDRNSELSHGNNAHELLWAVEAGMTPLQAIECATANGPEVLGAMAPLSGQLKVGYDADFIGLEENPLDDLTVLLKRHNISYVWKGGKMLKGPPVTESI